MPSYTGTGKSSRYKKQAELKKAAAGCSRIDTFFGRGLTKAAPSLAPGLYAYQPRSIAQPAPIILDDNIIINPDDVAESPAAEETAAITVGNNYPAAEVENGNNVQTLPGATETVQRESSNGLGVREAESEGENGGHNTLQTRPDKTSSEPAAESRDSTRPEVSAAEKHSQAASSSEANAIEYLDLTADDEDEPLHVPVGETVTALIKTAKKHKAFSALFTLQAVKTYLELFERYRRVPNVKDPVRRASLTMAKAVGKGKYFARKIRQTVIYIDRFRTLPPNSSGKHHAHPSLLNNERVHQAVRRFLTMQPAGEVRYVSIITYVQS